MLAAASATSLYTGICWLYEDLSMTAEIEDIAEKALMLSPSARAYLAELLLESLDYEENFPSDGCLNS
jgi:hypothetical protein